MKPKLGICIDCDNSKQVPLIAKRCQMHYWKHRAKLKQGKDGKEYKPKPIKQVSEKRKEENKMYSAKRALFLAENKKCQKPECRNDSTDVHHKRGRIGSNYLDVSTWLAVCRKCHRWIEDNPKEAKELGLSENRLTNGN